MKLRNFQKMFLFSQNLKLFNSALSKYCDSKNILISANYKINIINSLFVGGLTYNLGFLSLFKNGFD